MEAPGDFPFDVLFNQDSIIFSIGQSNISYRNHQRKEVYDDINNITTMYRCYSEKTELSMSFLIGTLDKKKIIFLNGNGWTDDEQKIDFIASYKELSNQDKNLVISFIFGV
jgi:hypothetical protein